MNTILKRVISLLLCFVMIAGYVPANAFAEEIGETVTTETTAVTTEATGEPSEETEAPSESTEATEPSKEATEPSTEATEPSTEATEPSAEATEPSTEAIEPSTEAVSEPTEETTEPTTAPVTRMTFGLSRASNVLDAAIFCSDVHGSTSDLTDVMEGVATSGVDYSAIGFVGDTCLTVANTTSTVQSALGDNDIAVMFSYASSHDTEGGADISTDWNYSGEVEGISDAYLVYTIRETDMQNNNGAESAFTTWYSGLTAAEKKLPIFIMSHRPLHARRNDNAGAAAWYDAISAAAKSSDIVFFWAHNHTGETSADTNAYYVEKNGTEAISVQGGSTVTPNFTYMNAGYINANDQNPARLGVATTVQITSDSLIFQDYNSSGAYSGTYAHNETVEREFATAAEPEITLSSIDVTGTTEYTVGGNGLDLTVTATYSDGTTADVTSDATFEPSELTASGNYTVTASYGGQTATIEVKAFLYDEDDANLIGVEAFSQGATALKVTWDDDADAVLKGKGLFTDYVVYDLALTKPGETTEYAMSLVDNMDIDNLAVYHVADDGTLTLVKHEIVNDCVVFTTDLTGAFAYGSISVPEGYTLSSITLANIPTDLFVGGSLNLENAVITAVYTKEGAEDYTRQLTVYDYDENNWSGYDVDVAGSYTAVFTYEGVTAELAINVWGDEFTVSGVTVALDSEKGGEYGVTEAKVTESTNENVATAIANVIEGDNYVAYDISLTYSEGYEATEDAKTVTLPIPEGVTNPVVYYVSDDGQTVTNMEAAKTEDGKSVTFTTDHFSTYVVGNSSTLSGTESDQFVPGNSTTTTEEKTVYVKEDAPVSGEQYLIVSTGTAGTAGYVLGGSSVTPVSGTLTVDGADGTYTYIETAGTLWTASGSGSSWSFANGSSYLGYTQSSSGNEYFGGLTHSYSVNTTASSTTWTLNNNQLYSNLQYSTPGSIYGGSTSRKNYYLTGGSSWSMGTSATNVYFYKPVTATITTTTGTVDTTYHMDIIYDGTATQEISAAFIKNGDTLQLGATITPSTPANGSYTVTSSNTNVATVENNGLVTFKGTEGETLIQATYTWTENGNTYSVSNYVSISVTGAIYDVEISQDGTTAAPDIIAQRNVQNGTTLELKALTTVQTDETTTSTATPDSTTWYAYLEDGSAADSIASIDQNGKLTFTGAEGTIRVMVVCKFGETTVNDLITIHVRKSNAVTPDESTTDFPRWPNEGAVRFDKTAQAVGNFSNTGVAQVELSMAGIPQKSGGAVDVVLMLDMTGSMDDSEMAAAEAAAKVFADQIVKNSDGTFNNSRIAVYAFNSGSSSPYELWAMSAVTAETYEDLTTAIESASDKNAKGGTPYDEALNQCRTVLQNTKIAGRKQFCVFVSDGAPTSFEYITGGTSPDYTTSTWNHSGTGSPSDSAVSSLTGYTEYYSTMMKEVDDVTVYTVGTGLTTSANPNALEILENIATDSAKAYVVASASDTTGISNAFTAIAEEIKQAASQIEVSDKITDEYEMIFQWPTAVKTENQVSGQEFYIEVVNYELDATSHERNGTYDVLTRVYLTENSDGTLAISRLVKIDDVTATSAGTTTTLTITPTYTAVEEGKKGYFNLVDDAYVYVADGTGGYNMTAGATVSGTADTVVLHTPYFSYEASTKVITWHITETAENSEIALRYFLYLTGSLESVADTLEEGDEGYVAPGTYPTNDYATLEYKNYKGNDCLQYFPEPQLTWNGAQVSYVFYLVNEDGNPVNTAGREVQFSEAVFVTSIHTETVVWNEATGTTSLEATKIAQKLLPTDYTLYDPTTQYEINVYMDETKNDLGNHFIITAGDGTTKVYNTKAGTKYSDPGTYTANNVDEGFDFANTTVAFAVVWERKLVPDTVVVDFGLPVDIDVATNDFVYNSLTAIGTNTPSAEINTGIYTESALDEKVDAKTGMSAELALGDHKAQVLNEKVVRFTPGSMEFDKPVTFNYETATDYYEDSKVKSGYLYSTVTVIPATTVYYEDSFVDLTVWSYDDFETPLDEEWDTVGTTTSATQDQDRPGESQISGSIDADNVYGYDGAYKTCSTYSMGSARKVTVNDEKFAEAQFTFYGTGFDVISLTSNTTGTITVDVYNGTNVTYSAENREKSLVVDTFYGYKQIAGDADGDGIVAEGEQIWVVDEDAENALYQVPVMKVDGLKYGQYTVVITAAYYSGFDHAETGSYDFYLDAIRIYDPTGNTNDEANAAYVKDGEGWPIYKELRNLIIAANSFGSDVTVNSGDYSATTTVNGVVFIDGVDKNTSIKDYTSYGPNNELYLAPGQSIAFKINDAFVDSDGNSVTPVDVQIAVKSVGSSANIEMFNPGIKVTTTTVGTTTTTTTSASKDDLIAETITTATDMYYSIEALTDDTIVISNPGESGILSITNIKFTFDNAASVKTETTTNEETGEETVSTASVVSISEAGAVYAMRSLSAYTATETVVEETTESETTEPSEPETSEPETTVPEETEPEETVPETTEPEKSEQEQMEEAVKEAVTTIVNTVVNTLKNLFSKWFR